MGKSTTAAAVRATPACRSTTPTPRCTGSMPARPLAADRGGVSRARCRTARSTATALAAAVLGEPEALETAGSHRPSAGRRRRRRLPRAPAGGRRRIGGARDPAAVRDRRRAAASTRRGGHRAGEVQRAARAAAARHDARRSSTAMLAARCPTPRSARAPISSSTPAHGLEAARQSMERIIANSSGIARSRNGDWLAAARLMGMLGAT